MSIRQISRPARVMAGIVLAATLGAVGGWQVSAEESSNRSTRPAKLDPINDLSDVEKRLNDILATQEQILANQQTIFQRLDTVMEELRIVKVRATSRGS